MDRTRCLSASHDKNQTRSDFAIRDLSENRRLDESHPTDETDKTGASRMFLNPTVLIRAGKNVTPNIAQRPLVNLTSGSIAILSTGEPRYNMRVKDNLKSRGILRVTAAVKSIDDLRVSACVKSIKQVRVSQVMKSSTFLRAKASVQPKTLLRFRSSMKPNLTVLFCN